MIKKYGLIGDKLKHSYSPIIHKVISKKLGINIKYEMFEVSSFKLSNLVLKLKQNNTYGVNVTIPYKTDIIDYLDDISDEVKRIGAVNTIMFKNSQLIGYNTDYYGFGMTLQKNNINIEGSTVYIMGTGGASKAIFQYLKDNNVSNIIFITRDIDNAKKKYPNQQYILYSDLEKVKSNQDLLINCTPLGMYGYKDETRVVTDYSFVSKFNYVIDIVYNPKKTKLLELCEEYSIKNTNGLYMLVAQAVKSQEIWSNIHISKKLIDEIYDTVSSKIYE